MFASGLSQNYYMKPKRAAVARQPSSSGESVTDYQQEPSRSQPLNLSQVTAVRIFWIPFPFFAFVASILRGDFDSSEPP